MNILTPENWEQEVLKSPLPVLVAFVAQTGCPHCDKYKPMFEKFTEKHPEIKCIFHAQETINSESDDITLDANIKATFPTTIAYVNGVEVNRGVGALPPESLLELFKTLQNISDEELVTKKCDLALKEANIKLEIAKQQKELFKTEISIHNVSQEMLRRRPTPQTAPNQPIPTTTVEPDFLPNVPPAPHEEGCTEGCQ